MSIHGYYSGNDHACKSLAKGGIMMAENTSSVSTSLSVCMCITYLGDDATIIPRQGRLAERPSGYSLQTAGWTLKRWAYIL